MRDATVCACWVGRGDGVVLELGWEGEGRGVVKR